MKKYKPLLKENYKYIDFTKDHSFINLFGELHGKEYNLNINWTGAKHGLNISCSLVNRKNGNIESYDHITDISSYTHNTSPEQVLSLVFIKILKLPVPKTDNSGSGLDVNHMIDTLIKKYKFIIGK